MANSQGIATPITSPVVVPISSIASPQYNVLNIQTSLQNTESNPTMASPPPGLDHSYIGYTDINSDVTMSSSDHSYTGQNLNQKSTKMFVGDMGMKMNAADTDQSYGAIVSPNKVLQLVPQPMVPISQASKSITSPKRIMKKTVRKDKALGQVGASDVMKSVSSLTSSSDEGSPEKKKKPPKKVKGNSAHCDMYDHSIVNGESNNTIVQTESYSTYTGTPGKTKKTKKSDVGMVSILLQITLKLNVK